MYESDKPYAKANQALMEGPNMKAAQTGSAGRQSSKSLLMEHAERLRKEAHQLDALAMQIGHLNDDAEAILYTLLSGVRR